ncbi:DUF5719 family protein [Georgenia sp. AZ-5]|uniref:DUF5719 family protein n=1 Tax=Georgenia sp. AZ-5 TaxID=3367526 RepID=UPI003753EA7C
MPADATAPAGTPAPETPTASEPAPDEAGADAAAPVGRPLNGATAARRREPRGRVVLRRAGATTSALVLLAAAAGIVVAGEYLPAADATDVAAPRVDVPAGTFTAVCAGPPSQVGDAGMSVDPELAGDVTSTTRTQLLTLPREDAAAAEGAYTLVGGGAPQQLARTGEVRGAVVEPTGAGLLEAEPAGDLTALAAGATVARTDAGDLRGLTATACEAPATTTWLVGGSTEVGDSAQLVLTNPGQTPATVDVAVWTSLGATVAPLLSGVVVAPGEQTTVLLEAAVTADPQLALRVDASGGEVTAVVRDHQLDGVVPAGIDNVTTARAPALTQTIPGVVLAESDVEDSASSLVRLVNPGEEVATAAVRLLGPDGEQSIPGAEAVELYPGAVVDITLAGIAPGAYGVEITSDQPVTGAVQLARTGRPGQLDPDVAPVDRAWTPAAAPLNSGTLLVPGAGDVVGAASVTLTNPGDAEVRAELVPVSAAGAVGEPVAVTVPARGTAATATADLGDDVAAVHVRAEGAGVAAAVVLTAPAADGELISVLPAISDPHDDRSVRVEVLRR